MYYIRAFAFIYINMYSNFYKREKTQAVSRRLSLYGPISCIGFIFLLVIPTLLSDFLQFSNRIALLALRGTFCATSTHYLQQ